MPVLGPDQVYVLKHGSEYHTGWCPAVEDKWDRAPRGLLVTLLSDIGARTPCRDCDRSSNAVGGLSAEGDHMQVPAAQALAPGLPIPLRVVGVAHGILFLAAGPEYRDRLRETAVEPASPLLVDGRRNGIVVRIEAARDEPLMVVQMDPRATFRDGPYQVRLRRPLQRSASKLFAVEAVEPAS